MLKGWLKSSDVQLVLLSLTVVHAIALNAPVALRSYLAGERWMPRLEKVLQRPPSLGVGRALAQVLLDWAYLFSREELGNKSRAALAIAPKYRPLLESLTTAQQHWPQGTGPSDQACAVAEELAMGMPPVGPRRPPDLVAMYLGEDGKASSAQPVNGKSGGGSQHGRSASATAATAAAATAFARLQQLPEQALAVLQPADDVPLTGLAILTASVESTIEAIRGNAAQLQSHAAATRDALRQGGAGRASELLTAGYVAAQRCHICRGWVQKLAQTMSDELAVSRLLSAIDVINAALAAWQALTSHHLYEALGISIPSLATGSRAGGRAVAPPSRTLRRLTGAAAAAAAAAGGAPAVSGGPGVSASGQDSSTDLLGLNELLGDLASHQDSFSAGSNQQGGASFGGPQGVGAGGRPHATLGRAASEQQRGGRDAWNDDRHSAGGANGTTAAAAAAAVRRPSATPAAFMGVGGPSGLGGLGGGLASLENMAVPSAPPVPLPASRANPFEGIDSAPLVSGGGGAGVMVNPFDDLLTPPLPLAPAALPAAPPLFLGVPPAPLGSHPQALGAAPSGRPLEESPSPWLDPPASSSPTTRPPPPPGAPPPPVSTSPSAPPLGWATAHPLHRSQAEPESLPSSAEAWPHPGAQGAPQSVTQRPGGHGAQHAILQSPEAPPRQAMQTRGPALGERGAQQVPPPSSLEQLPFQHSRRGWEPFGSSSEPSSPRLRNQAARSHASRNQGVQGHGASYQEQRTAPAAGDERGERTGSAAAVASVQGTWGPPHPPLGAALPSPSHQQQRVWGGVEGHERAGPGQGQGHAPPPLLTTPAFDAACSQLLEQHGHCHGCHAPAGGLHEAVAHLKQLVAAMQAEHAAALQALSAAHQAEVKSIKATSIQKFKELMSQQQQQQPVQQPPPSEHLQRLLLPVSMQESTSHMGAPGSSHHALPLYPRVPVLGPSLGVGALPKPLQQTGLPHHLIPLAQDTALIQPVLASDSLL